MAARVQALQRADQIEFAEGGATRDYYLPIVADAGELGSWLFAFGSRASCCSGRHILGVA